MVRTQICWPPATVLGPSGRVSLVYPKALMGGHEEGASSLAV